MNEFKLLVKLIVENIFIFNYIKVDEGKLNLYEFITNLILI